MVAASLGNNSSNFFHDAIEGFSDFINARTNKLDVFTLFSASVVTQPLAKGLEALALGFFSCITLFLLFPLALSTLFFPSPRGRVFCGYEKAPVGGALIIVTREGRFVMARETNSRGYYPAMRLVRGEYELIVSKRDYIFPERIRVIQIKDDFSSSVHPNFILQPDSSDLSHGSTYLNVIPPDPTRDVFNYAGRAGMWGLLVTLFFTLLYTTQLNFTTMVIFVVSTVLRFYQRTSFQANFRGAIKLLNRDQQGELETVVEFSLEGTNTVVGKTLTDARGNFIFYLTKGEKYRLSFPGYLSLVNVKEAVVKRVRSILIDPQIHCSLTINIIPDGE